MEEQTSQETVHCSSFSFEELKPWLIKKYCFHMETVELMKSTDDPHEREKIAVAALLDADDESIHDVLKEDPRDELCMLHYRELLAELMREAA